jgi:hypothetical protein
MNEQTLTRYLLGELPEDEQTKIEEQLFTDDAAFAQARALKAELTDNYVRGNLSASERRSYEQRFLTSPAGRNDAVFAKALTHLLATEESMPERAVVSEPKPSWWESITAFFRVPAFGVAMAALLLLVIGGVWWYQQSQRQPIEAQQAREAETRKQDIARGNSQQTESPTPLPQTTPAATQKDSPKPAPPTPKASVPDTPNTLLSFLLVPSMVRGENSRERITIPANTGRIQMQLDLDQSDQYQSYRAELRTKRGQLIQSQNKLIPRKTAFGKAVFFAAPANGIRNGDYEVTLFGVKDSGEVEEANFYRFTAVRR